MKICCAHDRLVALGEVKPNPRNPNRHPPEQIALLAKIITETGWRSPIVVSTLSGFVVKGHGRLEAARAAGFDEVPVDYQDYETPAQELADLIADNKIAELAEMDEGLLDGLLVDLSADDFDMDLSGFSDWVPGLGNDGETDPDVVPEVPEEPTARLGQIWKLGSHRLMCGDSTDKAQVEKLMGNAEPHLMVTDPPYGVEYDANWRNRSDRADGKKIGDRAIGKVRNDARADWREAWELFDGAVAYVWHAGLYSPLVAESLLSCGFEIRALIVWGKSNFVISRGHYHHKHEPCWYVVRKGKTGSWSGDRSQTTLWDIDKPMKSETGHSTQKPVECMERPIRNNSVAGDAVYDPFLGSGTTLIACEKTGRRCYGMELDPRYVDVIIQRWCDFTGIYNIEMNGEPYEWPSAK